MLKLFVIKFWFDFALNCTYQLCSFSRNRKCFADSISKIHASQCGSCSEVWWNRTWPRNMQTAGEVFLAITNYVTLCWKFLLTFHLASIKLQVIDFVLLVVCEGLFLNSIKLLTIMLTFLCICNRLS